MNYTIEFNKLNSNEVLEAVFEKLNEGANVAVTDIPSTEAQDGTVILFSEHVIQTGQEIALEGLSKKQKLAAFTQQLADVSDGKSAIITLGDVEAHAISDRRGIPSEDVVQLNDRRIAPVQMNASAPMPKVA